jgi:hypothetical protein
MASALTQVVCCSSEFPCCLRLIVTFLPAGRIHIALFLVPKENVVVEKEEEREKGRNEEKNGGRDGEIKERGRKATLKTEKSKFREKEIQ